VSDHLISIKFDWFGRRRIRELERELEASEERFKRMEWRYLDQLDRRIRDLEIHTDLVPLTATYKGSGGDLPSETP
jgi:hypothetical protein